MFKAWDGYQMEGAMDCTTKGLRRAGIVLAAGIGLAGHAMAEDRVIYGEDNRKDIYDPTNDEMLLEAAKSTAVLINDSNVFKNPTDSAHVGVPATTFKKAANLCSSERFGEQINPGFCSGFLVAPNVLVTAGHCVKDASSCAKTSVVFDFAMDTASRDLTKLEASKVYHCKSIVKQELQPGAGRDFAVIYLDRSVTDRPVVKISSGAQIQVGTEIAVIGHPTGLPTKISAGAKVRKNTEEDPYFVANLDTYGGNSGSAVFNMVTGEVEGILVRGETDFVYDAAGSCRKSKVCASDQCRGEDVTKTAIFAEFLPH
jgi:hypothetical protein